MAYNYTTTNLLSKIKIGNVEYLLKDSEVRLALAALEGKVGEVPADSTVVGLIEALQGKDEEIAEAIEALQEADKTFATKTQVAADIKVVSDALAQEVIDARAAEKANADEIARVDAALKLAIDDEDGEGLNSIKDLATWIEEHGTEAGEMSAAITQNANDIKAMDTAYKAADDALDKRLDDVEALLTGGDGSVGEQIEDAKEAAIDAAKKYADGELAKKEDKANLKALAYKDSASGTVAGETISGVKATGKSAGSINVTLSETASTVESSGDYTPAGTVNGGKVTAAGTVAVSFTNADAAAVVSTADYQPAGTVGVTLSNNTINEVSEITVTSSHVDPELSFSKLETEDVTIAAHNSMDAEVQGETLVFTKEMLEAISFNAVKSFTEGSKTKDGSISVSATPVTAAKTVGVASATFTGTVAEDLKVTGVTYKKHDSASATFTGSEVDVTGASFTGSAATINVSGAGKAYAVNAKEFIPGDVELAVGDIAVAAKEVTVS